MRPRNVIVLFVLMLLAGIGIFMLGEPEPVRMRGTLVEFDPRDVSEVNLGGQGNQFLLQRRAGASDQWDLVLESGAVRADSARVDDLLNLLSRVEVKERFVAAEVEAKDRDAWGLSSPGFAFQVTVPGEQKSARFGAQTRSGENVYADLGDDAGDVYVVPRSVTDALFRAFSDGIRDTRVSPIGSLDVGRVEVEQGGVTQVEVERDVTQVWKVKHPFKGYAHPTDFSTVLARLTGAKLTKYVEDDVKDLAQYGLDKPRARLVLTPRRESQSKAAILIGAELPEGGAYAIEEGSRSVIAVSDKFVGAVLADPHAYRDRSFSRLGIDGIGVTVRLGEHSYKLRKEGQNWDLLEPERGPTDGKAVRDMIEELRRWETIEFQDRTAPKDLGIDGTQFVEVERHSGELITLQIGRKDESSGGYWALRKGDGGPELVGAGPLITLMKGYGHFKLRIVREWVPQDISFIGREGPEGSKVKPFTIERKFDATKNELGPPVPGAGFEGEVDLVNWGELLAALESIQVERWIPWTPETMKLSGIENNDLPTTLRFEVGFPEERPAPANGHTQILIVGNPHPDGGYYAKFARSKNLKKHDSDWAFVLSKEFVEELLMIPLRKK